MLSGFKVIKKGNECVTLHVCVSALVKRFPGSRIGSYITIILL